MPPHSVRDHPTPTMDRHLARSGSVLGRGTTHAVRAPASPTRTCRLRRPRLPVAAAAGEGPSGGGDKDVKEYMDAESARVLLGVGVGASFDDVVRAKKRLLNDSGNVVDDVDIAQVEAAYDRLLMDSLNQRQKGNVAKEVRYADVPKAKPVTQVANELLQKLPGGGVTVEAAPERSRLAQFITFFFLSLWVYAQAVTPAGYDEGVPGTQIAAAVIAALYFQRQEKGLKFARAAGITFAGLAGGILLGSALEALLRVDMAPLLGIHNPGMIVGECGILGVWFSAAFLL